MTVRPFGSVWRKKKPSGGYYPGFYISFPLLWNGETTPRRSKKYGGATKAAARRVLARIETMVAEGVDAPQILHDVFGDAIEGLRTFVQLADLYKARPRPVDTDPETIKKENRRIDAICTAPWASDLVTKIKPDMVQKWLDERFAESSPATANRDRAKASAVFTWGIPRGYATRNPVTDTHGYDEAGRERVFWLTPHEVIDLLEVSSLRLRTFIVIATQTALRRGAIMRLCWQHFDFENGFVNPPPGRGTKGIPPRLKLTDALKIEMLAHRARCERTGGEDTLFENAIDTIRDDLRAAKKACVKIAPERRAKIGVHALRHTAASWMVQDGVPLYEVAKILGHGSVYVTETCAHLVPGFAERGINCLGARLRPEDLPASVPPTSSAARGVERSPASTAVLGGGPRSGPRDPVDDAPRSS
jgi:integrase